MKLNIKKIINVQSGEIPFRTTLDLSCLDYPQIISVNGDILVEGVVRSVAGALELAGNISVSMTCVCDRCLAHYPVKREIPVKVYLATELQDEENPDIFFIENDMVDLDEIFTTAFVFEMDSKFVCSEDCRGLCPRCGERIDDGKCKCGREIDSRLAVLQQLLDGDIPQG